MCGIFGYVGGRDVQEVLLCGLKNLEYRGYDSAGIYVAGAGLRKTVGKVAVLEGSLQAQPLLGHSGIAHTRWATHGVPNEVNSHPHTGASGRIFVVHNGIIENWRELKNNLEVKGVVFESETDTEVLAKLIGSYYEGDTESAVRKALAQVRGTYGIAVMSVDYANKIIVARMGSPIVIGIGDSECFVSSDPSALMSYTKKVVYLEDGELAIIDKDSYVVTSLSGQLQEKTLETMDWDTTTARKNGHAHFMLKEIFEAADVVRASICGRILPDFSNVKLGGLESVADKLSEIERLVIVGCGSAYYGGSIGRLLIEEYAHLPVEIELGSEYRYKKNFSHANTALLAMTQSGETADTLASVRLGKESGLLTLGIVNTVGSTISRETDAGVHNHAGPEMAVASTKAFVSQLVVLVLLAVFLGRQRGMSDREASEILRALDALPAVIESMLSDTSAIKAVAIKYANYRDMMYIGRKFHTGIAYEGSLKLKEVSYMHAEAYAGGELKHGSIAMLSPDFPVFAIVPNDDVFEKMMSNVAEVLARSAPVILLTTDDVKEMVVEYQDVILMPKVHPILQPIISTIPLQLFAYYVGIERGLDVDQPRNLAKSVTVE
jgi:glucosamine--fructose-6-phosphate aminotransferase (isomerizing)